MTDTKSIKSYTPGAESAARKLCRDWTGIPTPADVAEIISRETGDLKLREQNAEMLEALKAVADKLCGCHSQQDENWHSDRCYMPKVLAAIAKVEGH